MYQLVLAPRRRLRVAFLAITTCSLAVAAGCSRSADRPIPVSGRVLVDGKPAVGATVVFHPDGQPGVESRPVGKVDENGEFHLTTTQSNDGALPGKYRVTVSWFVTAPAGKHVVEGDERAPQNQLPDKYTRVDSTPLAAEVSRDQIELLTFNIKKK